MIAFQQQVASTLMVREATPADARELGELVRITFAERLGQLLSPVELAELTAQRLAVRDGRCHVALSGDTLVGYVVTTSSRRGAVDRLYVRSGENTREVAAALLAVARAASKQPVRDRETLDIWDRWGFVDLPALRACLARPSGTGALTAPGVPVLL